MFDGFSHYLSYGATDQTTARELTGDYDGLLVPGTVASFQTDGTRGFVLTLNASRRTRYVIDPRFPLFQNHLPQPKKSHEALARILGDETLISRHGTPAPASFDDHRVATIAGSWLNFNSGYTEVSSKHFDKYAERLGEVVLPENSQGPEYVLAPYAVAGSTTDPWWAVTSALWRSSVNQASGTTASRLVRVVAASTAGALTPLLADCDEQRLAVWVSGLDELDASEGGKQALLAYGRAVAGRSTNTALFALYGGFFSVLLGNVGLRGASHGIGYGESRDWVELPQSGPPPVRYYLPRAHRYVSQDLALELWRSARELVICHCQECQGRSPAVLDYHALMRHSVRCRHREIMEWSGLTLEEAAALLDDDAAAFKQAIGFMDLPRNLRQQADKSFVHLSAWADVLRQM
jgi:hypothetical protein